MTDHTATNKLTFFSLPAELRNQIYHHSLVQPDPILLPYAYQKSCIRQPALLLTTRLIRAEATPIFYGSNVFEAPSPAAAHRFLAGLQPKYIAQLRLFRPLDLVLPLDTVLHGTAIDAVRSAESARAVAEAAGVEEGFVDSTPPTPLPGAANPAATNAASQRWIDVLLMNLNRLFAEFGKGALAPEAVAVPIRRPGSARLVWLKVSEVQQFNLVRTTVEFRVREGDVQHLPSWRVEWREEC